jgi:protein TonB
MYLLQYLALFLFAAYGFAQSPPSYQPEIDSLADRLAVSIQATRRGDFSPKVLVADFANHKDQPNALGQQLADALSNTLAERLGPEAVVKRSQFQRRMQSAGITAEDLQSVPGIMRWNAAQSGANLLITGSHSDIEKTTTLHVTLASLPEDKEVFAASADLIVEPTSVGLLEAPTTWSAAPHGPTACLAFQATPKSKEMMAAAHVSPPTCKKCQPPSYTPSARAAKWQGIILLKAEIDERGQVASVVVLQGGPDGMGEQAAKGVRKWEFEPAMKDGKSIRICVPVEVAFRLY